MRFLWPSAPLLICLLLLRCPLSLQICSHRKNSVFISVCVCSYIDNIILYKSFFSMLVLIIQLWWTPCHVIIYGSALFFLVAKHSIVRRTVVYQLISVLLDTEVGLQCFAVTVILGTSCPWCFCCLFVSQGRFYREELEEIVSVISCCNNAV